MLWWPLKDLRVRPLLWQGRNPVLVPPTSTEWDWLQRFWAVAALLLWQDSGSHLARAIFCKPAPVVSNGTRCHTLWQQVFYQGTPQFSACTPYWLGLAGMTRLIIVQYMITKYKYMIKQTSRLFFKKMQIRWAQKKCDVIFVFSWAPGILGKPPRSSKRQSLKLNSPTTSQRIIKVQHWQHSFTGKEEAPGYLHLWSVYVHC
jgi:hypothetical protein